MSRPEEWRPVEATEYEVSSWGRVRRSLLSARDPGRVLRVSTAKSGYQAVSLIIDGRVCKTGLHRLVCTAFHGPPPSPCHHAAHGDGVRAHNTPDNLRWATVADNNHDKWLHGTAQIGERHARAKLSNAEVQRLREECARHIAQQPHGRAAPGWMADAAVRAGLSYHTFRKIVRGRGYPTGAAAAAPAPKRVKGTPRRVPSSLSFDQVLEIRRRHALGERLGVLAAAYGVHPATASKIAAGKVRKAA